MGNDSIFFSIIIPSYNRPDELIKALDSVRRQTFSDFEIIVVNDGSVESYQSVKENIKNSANCTYWEIKNSGVAAARNFGISKAQGRFICFLDDDDKYLENHLTVLYEKMRESNFQSGIYKTLACTNNGKEIKKVGYKPSTQSMRPVEKIFANMMVSCGVSISADILRSCRFNTTIPLSEDYELWTRIALRYPVFEINEYTTVYHFHNENRSASTGRDEEINKKHIEAFRQICAIPGLKNELPVKYIAKAFSKRFLWLSGAQKKNGKYFHAAINRLRSLYYKQQIKE